MLTVVVCLALVLGAGIALRWLGRAPAVVPRHDGAKLPRLVEHAGSHLVRALTGSAATRRRRRAVEPAWPAVADELAAGLRTGASLPQALASAAAREDQLGAMLRPLVAARARGETLVASGQRWAERATGPYEPLLAEAVQLAAWTGHADPVLFDTVADTARERLALAGELRAQTAQARASAAVLTLLPIAFTALATTTNADVAHFLLAVPAGWLCIATGCSLEAVGALWMRAAIRRAAP